MNYLFVIAGVILVIALYFLYLYLTNDTLSSGIQDLNEVKTTESKKLKSPGSTIFSYQFWVFITEPTAAAGKHIVKRQGSSNKSFNIILKGTQLIIRDGETAHMIATNNFPIQKWTCVLVNYSESTKILECYINGKLVYTKQLTNSMVVVSSDSLAIGEGGFKGYITKVVYLPEIISSDEAWKKYLEGNGQLSISSFFAGYNLNMAVSKDDVVQRNWKLFT
jgi:hypothetical protein